MGNEASAAYPESSDVVLHLNDVRNVPRFPDERIFAWVQQRHQENVLLTPDAPATFRVSRESVVRIDIWTQKNNGDDEAIAHGNVQIPIDAMLEKSGAALYHTWFLLDRTTEPTRSVREAFDYSMCEVARKAFAPKICLTLIRREEQLRDGLFCPTQSDRIKADRYAPLLLSHLQHLQLCQTLTLTLESPEIRGDKQKEKNKALKQQVKLLKAENEKLLQLMDDLQSQHRVSTEQQNQQQRLLQGQIVRMRCDFGGDPAEMAMSRRSQEVVEQITHEANSRIDKANEIITRFRAYAEEKDVEVAAVKEEVREQERDVKVLREQKNALMDIVGELYAQTAHQAALPTLTQHEHGFHCNIRMCEKPLQ